MEFANSHLAGPTVKNSEKHKDRTTCDFNCRKKLEQLHFCKNNHLVFSCVS